MHRGKAMRLDKTFLAERMSKLFGRQGSGPCACSGVKCGNNRCAAWWEIVMEDPEVYREVQLFYDRNTEWVEKTAAACPAPYGPPTG